MTSPAHFTHLLILLGLGSALTSLLGYFPGDALALDWARVGSQSWRLVTAFLFNEFKLPQIINLFILFKYVRNVEKEQRGTLGFAFLLVFNWSFLLLVYYLIHSIEEQPTTGLFVTDALASSLVTACCNLHGDEHVDFWFRSRPKSKYIPWVICTVNFLTRKGDLSRLWGNLVGLLYHSMGRRLFPWVLTCQCDKKDE